MPKPVYIICSQSGAEDKHSGLVSHFGVIEQLQVSLAPPVPGSETPAFPVSSFQIVAVWETEEVNHEDEYEYEMVILLPPGDRPFPAGSGKFTFFMRRHRFTANVIGQLPFEANSPGTMRIQSKIRKVGDQDWLTQEYPIFVQIVPAKQQNNGQPDANR